MFVEVIVLRNTPQLDRLFTYALPHEWLDSVKVGSRVMVPFGSKDQLEAIVFKRLTEVETALDFKIKNIVGVFSDQVHLRQEDIDLAIWMKEMYLCSFYEALQLILPSGIITKPTKWVQLSQDCKPETLHLSKAEKVILNAIPITPIDVAQLDVPYVATTVKTTLAKLEAKGAIKIQTRFEAQVKERYEEWLVATDNLADKIQKIPSHYKAQRKLAEYVLNQKTCPRLEAQERLKVAKGVVDRLIETGVIDSLEKEISRMPEFMTANEDKSSVVLNEAQEAVFSQMLSAYDAHQASDVLLHGVTGSGKTEVYAQLIETMMARGKKSILLVPEIALTPQIVARFCSRFGRERIALMHSKLSLGERYDQWVGIKEGRFDLIIGARSALFVPLDHLGLIVIDESHEQSYRSEKRPKYSTYEVAKIISQREGALLVSGSATPSINEYYESQVGKRHYYALKGRHNEKPVPKMQIVDMRAELMNGNRSILSRALHDAIALRLEKKEQVLIFLNRKGHSTFVSCRSCGFTLACPNCDVTLTYFKGAKTVKCNYCAYESFVPQKCPKCQSTYFKYFGVGTEKVEEQLNAIFEGAVIDRMDKTTTGKKGSVERIIEGVDSHKTDILIGTQMVSKGFDFKKVTLVGILSADLMLNLPNYQAAERAYQLFNQVAGRAGRGDVIGEVILQTYAPDHYAIQPIDYHAFYEEEIGFRSAMFYPPFSKMVNLVFLSADETCCNHYAKQSEKFLSQRLLKKGLQSKVELYPAHPALLKKVDGVFRYQILMKVDPMVHESVKMWVKQLEDKFISLEGCKISVDLDAQYIL